MPEHLVHRLSRHLATEGDLGGAAAERLARLALDYLCRLPDDADAPKVDTAQAMRWADRHEATMRRQLREAGVPSGEAEMPAPGAWFVQNLVVEVASLRARLST